jgi:hypothetical protein
MLFARCSFLGRCGVPSAATCHLAGPYGSKGLSYFDLKCRCSAHPGHREAYASSATAALPYAKPAIRVHREVHASPGRPRSFRNSLAPLTGDKGDNSSSRGKQAVHASPPVADAAQVSYDVSLRWYNLLRYCSTVVSCLHAILRRSITCYRTVLQLDGLVALRLYIRL